VGNVMIDSLVRLLPMAMQKRLNGLPDRYVLVTLHRPANVDDDRTLKIILGYLLELNGQGIGCFSSASPNSPTNS